MDYFFGEDSHALDPKGRIILPIRYRERLADAFVTSEVDCLGLWPRDTFLVRAAEMNERSKSGDEADSDLASFFFSGAREVNPDKQGRVAIPPHLRDFAGLERDVVIAGSYDHVEVWDAATWQDKKARGAQASRRRRPAAAGASS
jgi:MraZ protein